MAYLTRECPDCSGEGRIWKSKYGGNDPDVWDGGPCPNDNCDDGHVPIFCEGYKCRKPAVRIIDDAPLCETCATEAELDMMDEDEFRERQIDNGPFGVGS